METARAALVAALASHKDTSRQEFTVVFDGKTQEGESLEHPQKQLREGINVIFTKGITADDEIVRLVSDSRHPRNICVVTSDNKILRAARSSGCRTVTPMEFYDRITRPPGRAGKSGKNRAGGRAEPAAKYHGVPEGEVNYWLRRFRAEWNKDKDKDKKP
jgi:predicted RNA-binding protein with PIN domain